MLSNCVQTTITLSEGGNSQIGHLLISLTYKCIYYTQLTQLFHRVNCPNKPHHAEICVMHNN